MTEGRSPLAPPSDSITAVNQWQLFITLIIYNPNLFI